MSGASTPCPQCCFRATAGSYSSSGIKVVDNVFHGQGTWVQAGSPDPAEPDAARRTLSDPVMVTGNTFDATSTAIRTFGNAVRGDDAVVAATTVRRAGAESVAVDARDYDDPNDWGAVCRATGYLGGDLLYDGRGAAVYELADARVLYPTNCIELSLVETTATPATTVRHVGEIVTWTLTPDNSGLRSAPAGWSVTQLLPTGVELVSMTGDGYIFDGLTATATEALAVGARGRPVTVQARIITEPATDVHEKDVAYIAPLPPANATDLDGDGHADVVVENVSPLVVPSLGTDTDQSGTDNDAQGFWSVAGKDVIPTPTPSPSTMPTPTTSTTTSTSTSGSSTPTNTASPATTASSSTTPATPAPDVSSYPINSPDHTGSGTQLANTGAGNIGAAVAIAVALLLAGVIALVGARMNAGRRRP